MGKRTVEFAFDISDRVIIADVPFSAPRSGIVRALILSGNNILYRVNYWTAAGAFSSDLTADEIRLMPPPTVQPGTVQMYDTEKKP